MIVHIWTDGSVNGNPGPGGWAALLTCKNSARLVGGCLAHATNNIMETVAISEALGFLTTPCSVIIHTDSQYTIFCMRKVVLGLYPKSNIEYWEKVKNVIQSHQITMDKVPGHASDPYNNLVDEMARNCAFTQSKINRFYKDKGQLLNEPVLLLG